jgi:hypothetical protein
MAGFVIDIYIGFMLRSLVILWRDLASRKWPAIAGTIVRCHFERRGYGGDYVELRYRYKSNSERFQGLVKKPYIYPNYAEAFVHHHPGGGEIRVRVNPEIPAQSFPILG